MRTALWIWPPCSAWVRALRSGWATAKEHGGNLLRDLIVPFRGGGAFGDVNKILVVVADHCAAYLYTWAAGTVTGNQPLSGSSPSGKLLCAMLTEMACWIWP